MSAHSFAGNTAIVGIGATEFSKNSGRSELRLAVEAVKAAGHLSTTFSQSRQDQGWRYGR